MEEWQRCRPVRLMQFLKCKMPYATPAATSRRKISVPVFVKRCAISRAGELDLDRLQAVQVNRHYLSRSAYAARSPVYASTGAWRPGRISAFVGHFFARDSRGGLRRRFTGG